MRSGVINIGSVSVPLAEYATGASAILGIRDSGKTVTAKGIAEQLIDNAVPVFVFDAVGKWRWLKVAGRGEGFNVVVAGGNAPDLPLNPQSVAEIVRAALKERIPLVIDLFDRSLSKADWRRIVQTAIRIIHYENDGGAAHVFLEEAAEYCPQRVMDGETYAEVEKLVRMGGNASVGITLINQRSQEINKAVLDNCSTALVLGCQVGDNAIKAVSSWIERLDNHTAKEVTESLPKLPSGEAWVWTRKSLDRPTREKIQMCRSLHPDRRTPEVVLKSAKQVNTSEFVAKLSDRIPRVIEEAKANDPAALKAKIRELERQVKSAQSVQPKLETQVKLARLLTNSDRKRLASLINTLNRISDVADAAAKEASKVSQLSSVRSHFSPDIEHFKKILAPVKPSGPIPVAFYQRQKPVGIVGPTSAKREVNGEIAPVGQRILNALAEMELLKVTQPVREVIAMLAGYTHLASPGYAKAVSQLRTAGLVDYPSSDTIALTESGRQVAVWPQLPRSSEEIQKLVCDMIGGKASLILKALIEAYPRPCERMDVARFAGYGHLASPGFAKIVSRLRTLGFVEYPDSKTMKASKILFLNE